MKPYLLFIALVVPIGILFGVAIGDRPEEIIDDLLKAAWWGGTYAVFLWIYNREIRR